jgi:hypothetical protein
MRLAALLITMLSGLAMSDEQVLVNYFIHNQTKHHTVLDRASDSNTVSIASTGFGYYAWAIAAEDGTITRAEALNWINTSIDFVLKTNPPKNRGWLYHFTDVEGNPKFTKEVSSVDTAIYYLSAREAARRLKDDRLILRIETCILKINMRWMYSDETYPYFNHGYTWIGGKRKFTTYYWDSLSEAVIIYRMFKLNFKPKRDHYDLPLFVYYYPLCFYPDDEELVKNLKKAVQYQLKTHKVCGITACDADYGYSVNDPEIVSPVAIWAASVYSPLARRELEKLAHKKSTPSFNRKTGRIMTDQIGIDYGSCLMLITKGNHDNSGNRTPATYSGAYISNAR